MSSPASITPGSVEPAVATPPSGSKPVKNPSYPQRNHFGERQMLEDTLCSWEQKIGTVAEKLSVLATHPDRTGYERLFHQMMGARDQVAEAVRRMPLETGALDEEDRERLHSAIAALERLFQKWDRVGL